VNLAACAVDGSGPNDRLEEADRLPGEIDDDTLRKYFTLTKEDLEQVDQCRGSTNRLGFAIQLCTLRWHGYFLPDTREIPASVVEMIASQLGLLPIAPHDYPQNEKTRFEHLERIRQHLGFVRCDTLQRERLLNLLNGSQEPASDLFRRFFLRHCIGVTLRLYTTFFNSFV
jgi:TnpA family transposase